MLHRCVFALAFCAAITAAAAAQGQRQPLSDADIADIAVLLKLEDTRQFDKAELGRILRSKHPEVRRRAAVSIGRINDQRGAELLQAARNDSDADVEASIVFATGQLKLASAVEWLQLLLASPRTPPVVTREAAQALGKIQTPEARGALANYLTAAIYSDAAAGTIGEALLSIGRYTDKGDIAPVVRWAAVPDVEVRWRAAWALFRPRDPAAAPHLLKLIDDASGDVRHWAVRGLSPAVVDAAGLERATITSRLNALAVRDPDRRVRTEALRALLQYGDENAFGALVNALYSPDAWIAVSAAEAAGRFTRRAQVLAPLLVDVAEPKDPLAVRITVLPSLVALAPDGKQTLALATALAQSEVSAARTAGVQALGRLGDAGRSILDQMAADPAMAGRVGQPGGTGRGGAGGAGRGGAAQPPAPARPDADYRALAERWIVPAYNGAPPPRAIWETPRGEIEIELYPGEAPFGVEHFIRVVESGDIVGTEFTRVVPNFVAQQQAVRNATRLRDEVNRRGLTRANLSWASAGLDTGRPGYTLGHTPQPHNEGNFTALGRVVRGMDVVDKLELGDRIVSARMVTK
jgi:HEAT repeat protein/cyclophilin family peptidyl-prolyl cis-trans isomerase